MADATIVNLAPIMDEVIWPIVKALVPILASWIAYRVAKLLKVKEEETVRPRIQQALESAVAVAQAHTPTTYDVKDTKIAAGVNYMLAQVPQGLKTLGVTPEQVANKLDAELKKIDQKPTPTATIDVNVEQKPAT